MRATTLPLPDERYAVVLRRAAVWLVFLAPFFYATYGASNWLAAQRADVGSIVFAWEHAVPFLAWTIVPYWSINLLYGLALAANRTASGVDRLAGRYLAAQIVAIACFLAFPLTATFDRPASDGLPGFLFAVLGGFDKPFNQAPSLHVALLVIIWDHFRRWLSGLPALAWHAWCVLIGISVLTTWQHHFIDVPAGALLGLFALWLFPPVGPVPVPVSSLRLAGDRKLRRPALGYGAGAAFLLAIAWMGASHAPEWLLLLWPALALAIVSFGYATRNPGVFQKRDDGSVTLASHVLLWPYRLGARLNAFLRTRGLAPNIEIADRVFLGRFPRAGAECDRFATVVDLTAELVRPAGARCRWIALPMLDLVPATEREMRSAAAAIEGAREKGQVLVCCALGFQRSAGAVAQWLVDTGRAENRMEARTLIARSGRPVHLSTEPVA